MWWPFPGLGQQKLKMKNDGVIAGRLREGPIWRPEIGKLLVPSTSEGFKTLRRKVHKVGPVIQLHPRNNYINNNLSHRRKTKNNT
jgi:hypothetical protein